MKYFIPGLAGVCGIHLEPDWGPIAPFWQSVRATHQAAWMGPGLSSVWWQTIVCMLWGFSVYSWRLKPVESHITFTDPRAGWVCVNAFTSLNSLCLILQPHTVTWLSGELIRLPRISTVYDSRAYFYHLPVCHVEYSPSSILKKNLSLKLDQDIKYIYKTSLKSVEKFSSLKNIKDQLY